MTLKLQISIFQNTIERHQTNQIMSGKKLHTGLHKNWNFVLICFLGFAFWSF